MEEEQIIKTIEGVEPIVVESLGIIANVVGIIEPTIVRKIKAEEQCIEAFIKQEEARPATAIPSNKK